MPSTGAVPTIVIGAGISGLVCAHALRSFDIDALVLESSGRPGGVIRSEQREGFLFECGPQSFTSTYALSRLAHELGLANELVEAPPRAPRYVLVNGSLRSEEHTSELQSHVNLVCRLLLEKKK